MTFWDFLAHAQNVAKMFPVANDGEQCYICGMKISIRYENKTTFTGEIDAIEYSVSKNIVILWCGSRKIELCHYKETGDDWVHMDVRFRGRIVEFRNDFDDIKLPVDYDKTYNDPDLQERFSSRHMRAKQYISDVLHETITEEAALGKILTDMFLKG